MAFVNLLEAIYPVGAVYISTVNVSPSSSIGGTWTQITDAVLRASKSVGYAGSDTHAITIEEMPRHRHLPSDAWDWICATGFNTGSYNVAAAGGNGNATTSYDPDIVNQGQGVPMSLVPRAYNCLIWYRIA